MTPSPERDHAATPSSAMLTETLEELLRFGAQTLRAGDTAFRVRQSMGAVARGMGIDALSVQLGFGSITATARRGSETATLVREVGAPGVNTGRIEALNALASATPTAMTPRELARKLAAIEGAPPRYSIAQISAAIGAACGAFAFLNGGTGLEVAAAAVSGGIGQCLRTLLLRRRFNQYVVTAMCALVASGVCSLIFAVALLAGFGDARHTVGLVSSVLFLVPGFPLIASLLDLLQHETAAALTRLAYAMVLLLNAAFGLYFVIAVVGFSIETPPPLVLTEPLMLMLRALASFSGACSFAILYNTSWRTVLYVGVLAAIGNEIRLALHDSGLALPPASLLAAFAVGLMASQARRWLKEARITLTIPGVIMMVPGLYAFEALVQFKQGEILAALGEAVMVGFIVGAMAMGLAVARFVSQPEWLRE